MGYRGKLAERQARQLRRTGLPLAEIAARLGVSKSSVSLWVRDAEFEPRPPVARGRRRAPNALQRRKQAEIDQLVEEGRARIGRLSERESLVAGVALYAGEGSGSHTGLCPTHRSGAPSMCMVASRSVTVAARPTEVSWGSSARSSAALSLRGSSIGRALGC
jgi:hypothetical protein